MNIQGLSEVIAKMLDDEYRRGYNHGLERAIKLVKTNTGLDDIDIERRRAETQ